MPNPAARLDASQRQLLRMCDGVCSRLFRPAADTLRKLQTVRKITRGKLEVHDAAMPRCHRASRAV
ncbi:MAG TPA: hypothetical protein EYP98_11685 [Planctomycetes bacterium]|nr:hypothetical protein [Planctomycetota bacterium]